MWCLSNAHLSTADHQSPDAVSQMFIEIKHTRFELEISIYLSENSGNFCLY